MSIISSEFACVSLVSSEYKRRLCLCINCAVRVHRQTLPSCQLYLEGLPTYQSYLQSTNADCACVINCAVRVHRQTLPSCQLYLSEFACVSLVSSEYKRRLCLCINCAVRVHRQTLPSCQLYLEGLPAYQSYLQSTNADSACVSIVP